VVIARCDERKRYFSPWDMAEFSPGGRYNAYSGTCGACAEEGPREAVGVAIRADYESFLFCYSCQRSSRREGASCRLKLSDK
jgi:hypothetical protein